MDGILDIKLGLIYLFITTVKVNFICNFLESTCRNYTNISNNYHFSIAHRTHSDTLVRLQQQYNCNNKHLKTSRFQSLLSTSTHCVVR